MNDTDTLPAGGLAQLSGALNGLDQLGTDNESRRRRVMVIDNAWNGSDGSVFSCAKTLGTSYENTLGLLTNPAVKLLPQNDPRVQALEDVKAEGKKPYPYDIDPTGKMEAASERRAMAELKANPNNQDALETLRNVTRVSRQIENTQTQQQTKTRKTQAER